MARLFDELELQCREYVQEKGLTLDAGSDEYNTLELCKAICGFMVNKGFGPAQSKPLFRVVKRISPKV